MLAHFESRRQKIVFLALVAGAFGCLAVAVASVAHQIGTLSPGFVVWENLVVPAVASSSWSGETAPVPPIPFRSVVTHVDGKPVRNAHELRALVAPAPEGTMFRYRFERSGQVQELALPTTRLHWGDVLPLVASYLLIGIVLLGSGLVVFYFKPGLSAAHSFIAPSIMLGGMLLLALDAFSSFWLHRLCFALDSLLPAGLLHFALCFPDEKQIVKQHPRLKAAIYVPFAVLAILQNVFLTTSPEHHLLVSDLVYASDAAAAFLAALSLVLVIGRSGDPVQRQQAKAVAAGFSVAAFVPALAILAVVLFGVEIPFNPFIVFLIVSPLSIGYAIARHNLFEVDRFLRTGVVYGALSIVVFVSYAGTVLAGERWLGAENPLSTGLIPLYILLVLLFAEPLRRRIQAAVDRLFYRQAYSYRATVESTSRALASLLDTEHITSTVVRTATDVMSVEWALVDVFGRTAATDQWYGSPPERVATAQGLFPKGDVVPRTIAEARRLVTKYDLSARPAIHLDALAFDRIKSLDAILLLPLCFEKDPVGLLLLGEKMSGAFYSDEDVQLLQTLGNQAALALTNARAYEDLRRAQQELVQAERLAAVGELSATVAHGIRNPLAGIRAAAQFAREEIDSPATMQESFDDIITETDRLERRVRAILDLARPFEAKIEPCHIDRFVRDFVDSVQRRIPAGVSLSVSHDTALPLVGIDPRQLNEVLDALVVNAVEAMNGAGELHIRTLVQQDDGTPPRVALMVTDTGPGIDAARLERIFDLFYTTKASGTGIGLAMARRLVERQGGQIDVASTPGRGTTFTLSFPIARSDQPAAA